MKVALNELIKPIAGDWGSDDVEGVGVNVIRTANFRNDGKIDYTNIIKRLFQKKTIDENGREIYSFDSVRIEEKKLLNNDIIIEKSGGGPQTPVGRVVYFEKPNEEIYLANNFTQVLRVDSEKIIPKYLFYYLRYLYFKGVVYKYQNQTTGLANLKLEKYLKEEILIPDFARQNLIAAQLDIIQENIELRKQSIDVLSNLIHSTYFQMFGDPVNNQKGFQLKKLNQLVSKNKIITYGIVQAGPNVENGIPYVRTGDIKNGKIVTDRLLRTSPEIAKKHNRSKCGTGDIIMSIRATVGQCAILPKELDGANLTQGTARISPDKSVVNTNYLFTTLQSKGFQFLLNNYVKGSTFKEITLEKLRDIKIPVPEDIQLLDKFSSIYETIENVKNKVEQSLEILQQLFQVILQEAFKPDAQIDEEPIFKDLIKKLSISDLIGNKQRLTYLLKLFEENIFDNNDDYMEAKGKLFHLISANEIEQQLVKDKITLRVK